MTLLKRILTGEEEDSELKTAYQYVVDLRDRIEETCELATNELSEVQVRNHKYYNQRTRERKLHVGDSVLLLLPTEQNKLTLAWRGPYKVVGTFGEVDYKIEMIPGKVKMYHINMLKRYFHRENEQGEVLRNVDKGTQEAIPLKDINASTVAEALLEIFSRVGLPYKVNSDRGSQFRSEMIREVYRLLDVKQSITTPYHAMGNGDIENFNKTIKNLLKKVAAERPKDWHHYLGPLMFAVRDTSHHFNSVLQ